MWKKIPIVLSLVWTVGAVVLFLVGHASLAHGAVLPGQRIFWMVPGVTAGLSFICRRRAVGWHLLFALTALAVLILQRILSDDEGRFFGEALFILFTSLVVTVFLHISALGQGCLLFRLLGLDFSQERSAFLLQICAGWAVQGLFLLLTGITVGWSLFLLVPWNLIHAILGLHELHRAKPWIPTSTPAFPHLWLLGLLAWAVLGLSCGAPATDWDVMAYHLDLPKQYWTTGRILEIPFHYNANMPHLCELLYVLPLVLKRPEACQMLHAQWALFSLFLLGSLLNKRALPGAFLLLGCCPMIFSMASSANVELLLGFFFTGGVVVCWSTRLHESRWIWIAGLLAGSCVGVKYTGLWYALPIGILSLRRWGLRRILSWSVAGGCTLLPWLARNAWVSGNPLFPWFHELFQSPWWNPVQQEQLVQLYGSIGMGKGFIDLLFLPYRLLRYCAWSYSGFNGVVSPLYLALLPWALGHPNSGRQERWIVLLLPWILWTVSVHNLRYLVPLFPMMAFLGCQGLLGISHPWIRRAAWGCLLLVSLITGLHAWTHPSVTVALGKVSREAYLDRFVLGMPFCHAMNRELQPEERVLGIWWNQSYYLENPALCDMVFEASWIFQLIHESSTPAELRDRLDGLGIHHLLLCVERMRVPHFHPSFVKEYGPSEYQRDLQLLHTFLETECVLVHRAHGFEWHRIAPPDFTSPSAWYHHDLSE